MPSDRHHGLVLHAYPVFVRPYKNVRSDRDAACNVDSGSPEDDVLGVDSTGKGAMLATFPGPLESKGNVQ